MTKKSNKARLASSGSHNELWLSDNDDDIEEEEKENQQQFRKVELFF